MKQIIFKFLIFFKKYFPFKKGKYMLSNIISKIFGTFWVKTNGFYLKIMPNSSMDLSYFMGDTPSHEVIGIEVDKLTKGANFVDVGANIGYFSFCAALKVQSEGTIYSFEPSYREYSRFIEGIQKNHFRNILPMNVAIGNLNGTVQLNNFSNHHSGLNSVLTDYNVDSYNVYLYTLDSILGLDKDIDLIKIDVEGFEMNVLLGCEKLFESKKIKKLVIEITPELLGKAGFSKKQLYDYLYSYGYSSKYNLQVWQYDEVFELKYE